MKRDRRKTVKAASKQPRHETEKAAGSDVQSIVAKSETGISQSAHPKHKASHATKPEEKSAPSFPVDGHAPDAAPNSPSLPASPSAGDFNAVVDAALQLPSSPTIYPRRLLRGRTWSQTAVVSGDIPGLEPWDELEFQNEDVECLLSGLERLVVREQSVVPNGRALEADQHGHSASDAAVGFMPKHIPELWMTTLGLSDGAANDTDDIFADSFHCEECTLSINCPFKGLRSDQFLDHEQVSLMGDPVPLWTCQHQICRLSKMLSRGGLAHHQLKYHQKRFCIKLGMSPEAYKRLVQEWDSGPSATGTSYQGATTIPGLIENIMTSVRETCEPPEWMHPEGMHLNVDPDEFELGFINAVRSIKPGTFEKLGREVMECVLSALHEMQEQSVREQNQRLQELENEMWEFLETWAAGGRTLSAATKNIEQYAALWSDLGEPTGQEEWAESARFNVNLEAKLIIRDEQIASGKLQPLMLDWLADTLNLALTARLCCRSIASGHTSSSWESVGVPIAA
jgi:hypothetical protein